MVISAYEKNMSHIEKKVEFVRKRVEYLMGEVEQTSNFPLTKCVKKYKILSSGKLQNLLLNFPQRFHEKD